MQKTIIPSSTHQNVLLEEDPKNKQKNKKQNPWAGEWVISIRTLVITKHDAWRIPAWDPVPAIFTRKDPAKWEDINFIHKSKLIFRGQLSSQPAPLKPPGCGRTQKDLSQISEQTNPPMLNIPTRPVVVGLRLRLAGVRRLRYKIVNSLHDSFQICSELCEAFCYWFIPFTGES